MPKPTRTITQADRDLHEERMKRIHDAFGTRTQVHLAEAMGVRQSSISDAKRRASIPAEWLLKIMRLTGYSPDWIMYGVACGHRFLIPSNEHARPVNAATLRAEIEAQVRAEVDNLTTVQLLARLEEQLTGQAVVLVPAGRYDVHLTTRGDKVHGPREVTLVPLRQNTGQAPDRADHAPEQAQG